jgi:hypothetical protein
MPGLLGAFARQTDTASEIHQSFYRLIWENTSPLGRVGLLCKAAWWPVTVLADSSYYTFRNARIVADRHGKPVWRQFAEQLALGLRQGIHPRVYYAFELFKPAHLQQVNGYLQRYETKDSLYLYLKSAWRVPTTPLNDKFEFEKYLRDYNLPTVHAIAAFINGKRIDSSDPLVLPHADLFLKPMNGRGGEKCMRFNFIGTGWRATGSRKELSQADLVAHIISFSRRTPCILQHCYRPHRELVDLAGMTLATIRVLSMTDVNGDVHVMYAAFRMPRRHNAVVDNFHAGGIAAAVDFATGRLGAATDLGLSQSLGWVDRHPSSNAPIRGRVLPYWKEAIDLVRRAHSRAFKDRIMIGWDIAITDDGPIIVEGNAGPDLDIIQRVGQIPLGSDQFGELIMGHLRGAALQSSQQGHTSKAA